MRLSPGGRGSGDGVSLQRQALGAESRDLPSLPTAPPLTEKLGARAQAPIFFLCPSVGLPEGTHESSPHPHPAVETYLKHLSQTTSKESACNAGDTGDTGSIPGSGRSPGGGNGSPLLYSCLGNPMDRGAWWATVHGFAKSRTPQSD